VLLKELKKSFKLTNNFITMTCPSGMKSPKVKGVWSKSCGQAKNKNYAFADEKKKNGSEMRGRSGRPAIQWLWQ